MPYGIYVAYCDCGWHTISKHGEQAKLTKPVKCVACDKDVEAEFTDRVAEVAMGAVEIKSRFVQKHAEQHGLLVYQLSKNRWVVLRQYRPCTIPFKDGEVRSFMELEELAKGDWQVVMKYIRDHSPALPKYLE